MRSLVAEPGTNNPSARFLSNPAPPEPLTERLCSRSCCPCANSPRYGRSARYVCASAHVPAAANPNTTRRAGKKVRILSGNDDPVTGHELNVLLQVLALAEFVVVELERCGVPIGIGPDDQDSLALG